LNRTILVTNDDGLYSSGLIASYEALKDLGEVFVVAPAVQKSGVGRSISLMEPIRVSEVSWNGIKAYAVDGTPTDSVIIGIHEIIGEVPDLVVSGVNLGENISTEAILTSGTVGAAFEAATQGSAAISISLEVSDIDKFEFVYKELDFELCKKILKSLAEKIFKNELPHGVDVLNVNVPAEFKGEVEFTRLARKLYKTRIDIRRDPRGRKYFWIDGEEIEDAEEGTDLHAIRKGRISITPLTLDNTSRIDIGMINRWFYDR
jgi:5'-nucleotidase